MNQTLKTLQKMRHSMLFLAAALVVFSSGCGAQTSKGKNEIVLLSTDYGDMKIMLYDETPVHKENFLKLAGEGYYDGLIFHRVINGFMIQGGDPKSRTSETGEALGDGGPEYTLPAEFNPALYHKKGALAAARQGDQVNPEKKSSGSQFYIVQGKPVNDNQLTSLEKQSGVKYTEEQKEVYRTLGGTPHLDHNYTVFGEVIEGMDVIDKIAAAQTDNRNRPLENIRMTMKLVKK
jgi:peptidyl-prolyl cis-trans isomerase B (cyclophilin B)